MDESRRVTVAFVFGLCECPTVLYLMLHIFLHCVCSLALLVRGLLTTRGLFYLRHLRFEYCTPVIIFGGGVASYIALPPMTKA